MAKAASASERLECAEAKPHGRIMVFPGASYKTPRRRRSDLRAQFERLLILVLCALWGLGMTLWALAAAANFEWKHGTATANATTTVSTSYSAVANFPITVARYVIGW